VEKVGFESGLKKVGIMDGDMVMMKEMSEDGCDEKNVKRMV